MKKNIFTNLHRLFLFLSIAYIGLAVLGWIIWGPFQTELFGLKIFFTSLLNPIRISLGLFMLSFIFSILETDKGRSTFTGFLKKVWLMLQTGGLPSKPRIYWIDNLRTLAILLMVFAHTNHIKAEISSEIIYIYSFHMPLFFFISGLTLNPKKNQGWKKFLTRKISTLLIPYFFFSLLGYGLFLMTDYPNFSFSSFANALYRIIYADTDLLAFAYDGPLWFLPCLFLTEVEFYFISFLKKGAQIGVIGVLVVLGFVYGPRFRYVPWTAAASCLALLFYWVGFLLKDKIPALKSPFKPRIILLGIMISLLFSYLNGPVSMAVDYYGNPFYFLLAAGGGIIYVTLLITYTRPNRILTTLGMNTLIILGLHGDLLFFVIPKGEALINLRGLYSLIPLTDLQWLNAIIIIFNASFISLFLTLIQIGIIFLLIPVFNRKLYPLLGRKKPNPSG
jgi:acyltransferase